jgi:hypothetical protein
MGRACGIHGEEDRHVLGVPVVKTEGKRSLGRLGGDWMMIYKWIFKK